jgi:TRAP-type C4-dicarboxylate transport system permease small subunit
VSTTARTKGLAPYWTLRVLESALLVAALVGIGLFAWSIVDIIRIEVAPGAASMTAAKRGLPSGAWPGIFIFFGCMVALQVVRMILPRYRRDDGTPRGDERAAARATAEVLASTDVVSEPEAGPANDATDA